jgi:hypothetical protein
LQIRKGILSPLQVGGTLSPFKLEKAFTLRHIFRSEFIKAERLNSRAMPFKLEAGIGSPSLPAILLKLRGSLVGEWLAF